MNILPLRRQVDESLVKTVLTTCWSFWFQPMSPGQAASPTKDRYSDRLVHCNLRFFPPLLQCNYKSWQYPLREPTWPGKTYKQSTCQRWALLHKQEIQSMKGFFFLFSKNNNNNQTNKLTLSHPLIFKTHNTNTCHGNSNQKSLKEGYTEMPTLPV